MFKNYYKKTGLLIAIVGLVLVFRSEILASFSNFLIVENDFEHIENAFVLSGGAFDRGNHAAKLYNENKISNIICSGENKPPNFKAVNLDILESEVTQQNIRQQIADTNSLQLLKIGTSTIEESEAILNYCKQNKLKECLIISSKFHTRRIKNTFHKKFEQAGISVFISGANSSSYNENKWWQSENGLIALNNEYIKLMYYFVKY